uniref:Uncharacterized protein n=1 Tax=Arundo donax TaxID=35708 RepID=A0A0A9BZR8_ARUDO
MQMVKRLILFLLVGRKFRAISCLLKLRHARKSDPCIDVFILKQLRFQLE